MNVSHLTPEHDESRPDAADTGAAYERKRL